jgi:hypothetical protein
MWLPHLILTKELLFFLRGKNFTLKPMFKFTLNDLFQDNVRKPYFNTWRNKATGLTMAINDTWSNNVIIREYEFDGETFKGTLQFNIYDNFGLDSPDIEKHGHRSGFNEWFMLQHYDGYQEKYKPFITVIQFDVEFSGRIDK